MNNIDQFTKRKSPNRFRKPNRNYNAHGVALMRAACTDGPLWPAFQHYFAWLNRKHLKGGEQQ
jgi:hypothetical protein